MKKRPTTKQRRESKALSELQDKHSYMFQELSHRAERSTMQYQRDAKTGKSVVTPAVCIKLVVPSDSALGIGIIEMRKKEEKKKGTKR